MCKIEPFVLMHCIVYSFLLVLSLGSKSSINLQLLIGINHQLFADAAKYTYVY